MGWMIVERAFQHGQQVFDHAEVLLFRQRDGLLGQVVAQHDGGVGFQHQIGIWRPSIQR